MAERTGLEPATSTVTVWRSNQLNYRSLLIMLGRLRFGTLETQISIFLRAHALRSRLAI